jgi:FAD dependent oxidoreductase TIGR03364
MANRSAIVIGAGIVGLATARALAKKGFSVTVFERSSFAAGASVRNFGMVWPIGQPAGELYDRAIRSRNTWEDIGRSGAFWNERAGSLHLAHHPDEWQTLEELYELFRHERNVQLLGPEKVQVLSPAVNARNLLGGLYSSDELIVDPREAIANLPAYLHEKFGVLFHWNKCVTEISGRKVTIGNSEAHEADLIFVCSGADFETLYPEQFSRQALTKCKLQMMRLAQQPESWRIGPALCGGLSLIHYKSFLAASSLPALKKRYEAEMPGYIKWGIHVMVSQNGKGELTVGDSHEYGSTFDPFDKQFINSMITDYLRSFAEFKNWQLLESWNGTYAKLTNGEAHLFFSPASGVYVLNGLGGAGMTLSFGLAEDVVTGHVLS